MRVTGATAWTGGQYSLYRVILGVFLAVHFFELVPYGTELFSDHGALPSGTLSPLFGLFPNILALSDTPSAVNALLWVGVAVSVFFAIGWTDRLAALLIWYILACLYGRNPLIADAGMHYVGWLLLAHLFLPRAPYGSVAALGREDPGGGWRMPWTIWGAAWVVMSAGYAYGAAAKLMGPSWLDGAALLYLLDNPLARDTLLRDWLLSLPHLPLQIATWAMLGVELLFLPLAIFRRTRGWAWLMMVLVHLGLACIMDLGDFLPCMLILHLFTFDPGWLSRPTHTQPRIVFYDSTCGLCHRAIRLLIAEDPDGIRFHFAPLQGETFAQRVPEEVREQLPDSLVVVNPDSKLRVKGAAVTVLLSDLGGLWRLLGLPLRLLPGRVRDLLYDLVAGNRYRLFPRTEEACPLMPPELRERFLP
jgi:predicted DCC family thiol-disulfide oxidoreductase YuxK